MNSQDSHKKLDLQILKTDYGLINPKELDVDENSVLLMTSMAGYFAEQDMDTVYNTCQKKKEMRLYYAATTGLATASLKP